MAQQVPNKDAAMSEMQKLEEKLGWKADGDKRGILSIPALKALGAIDQLSKELEEVIDGVLQGEADLKRRSLKKSVRLRRSTEKLFNDRGHELWPSDDACPPWQSRGNVLHYPRDRKVLRPLFGDWVLQKIVNKRNSLAKQAGRERKKMEILATSAHTTGDEGLAREIDTGTNERDPARSSEQTSSEPADKTIAMTACTNNVTATPCARQGASPVANMGLTPYSQREAPDRCATSSTARPSSASLRSHTSHNLDEDSEPVSPRLRRHKRAADQDLRGHIAKHACISTPLDGRDAGSPSESSLSDPDENLLLQGLRTSQTDEESIEHRPADREDTFELVDRMAEFLDQNAAARESSYNGLERSKTMSEGIAPLPPVTAGGNIDEESASKHHSLEHRSDTNAPELEEDLSAEQEADEELRQTEQIQAALTENYRRLKEVRAKLSDWDECIEIEQESVQRNEEKRDKASKRCDELELDVERLRLELAERESELNAYKSDRDRFEYDRAAAQTRRDELQRREIRAREVERECRDNLLRAKKLFPGLSF